MMNQYLGRYQVLLFVPLKSINDERSQKDYDEGLRRCTEMNVTEI